MLKLLSLGAFALIALSGQAWAEPYVIAESRLNNVASLPGSMLGFTAGLGYRSKHFAAELGYENTWGGDLLRYSSHGVTIDGYFRIPLSAGFTPFVTAGGSYSWVHKREEHFDQKKKLTYVTPLFYDKGWSYHTGAGLQWRFVRFTTRWNLYRHDGDGVSYNLGVVLPLQ